MTHRSTEGETRRLIMLTMLRAVAAATSTP